MIDLSAFRAAFDEAVASPKVATGVALLTTSLGASSALEIVQGFLGFVSLMLGCLIGLLVIRIHVIKYKLLKRAWDQGGMDKGTGDES